MLEFFRGWKRKVGCVTLVMALVTTGAWITSLQTGGEYCFGKGESRLYHSITLRRGGLIWNRFECGEDETMNYGAGWTRSNALPLDDGPFVGVAIPFDIDWRWKRLGFDLGEWHWQTNHQFRVLFLMIPFAPIIIPLTAISAWLLLSKPRAKIKPPATPAGENA
jgi:hypothetical protein